MKTTINGKRYDTDKCEVLGERDHRSGSGNYSGTSYLLRAGDGTYLAWTDTNGQDLYLCDSLDRPASLSDFIDSLDLYEEQEARLEELGLLEVVPPVTPQSRGQAVNAHERFPGQCFDTYDEDAGTATSDEGLVVPILTYAEAVEEGRCIE